MLGGETHHRDYTFDSREHAEQALLELHAWLSDGRRLADGDWFFVNKSLVVRSSDISRFVVTNALVEVEVEDVS